MNTLTKPIAIILACSAVLLVLVLLAWGSCSDRDRARQAKNAQTQSEARTVSATEAINTINELGERSDATDAQVENATDAIRQADPADRDAVFRYHACLLQHRTDCDRL